MSNYVTPSSSRGSTPYTSDDESDDEFLDAPTPEEWETINRFRELPGFDDDSEDENGDMIPNNGTSRLSAHLSGNNGTTRVSAIHRRGQASAEFRHVPGAHAHFQPLRPEESGRVGVYSHALGSTLEIPLESKKKKKLLKMCQQAFEEAKALVYQKSQGAYQVAVDVRANPSAPTKNIVHITYRDNEGNERRIDHNHIPIELIGRLEKIKEKINPHIAGRTPDHFELSSKETLPKSCNEFLTEHYAALESTLDEGMKPHALRNIVSTEALIQGFMDHLGRLIQNKERDLENIPSMPPEPYRKATSDLDELRKLSEKLHNLDRYAVYWAVASWGNLGSGDLNTMKEQLRGKADKVTIGMKKDLNRIESLRQEKHYFKSSTAGKYLIKITPYVEQYQPLEPKEMEGYAIDAGNLLLPDRWESMKRADQTQRVVHKPCVEQLIVQMMLNLNNPEVRVDQTHPILDELSETNRISVTNLLNNEPRTYAQAVHAEINRTGTHLSPQTLIDSLLYRKNASHYRFQQLVGKPKEG